MVVAPPPIAMALNIQGEAFDIGEQIDVFINENSNNPTTTYPQPLVYTAESARRLTCNLGPQYFPLSLNGVNIYGYYPSGVVSSVDAGTIIFEVQNEQLDDRSYKNSDLMFGQANNPVQPGNTAAMGFTHLLSKVTVRLNVDVDTDNSVIVVELRNVSREAELNPATGEVMASGNQNQTVLAAANGMGISETSSGIEVSAILPPQTIARGMEFIRISIVDEQSGSERRVTYHAPRDRDLQLEGGKVHIIDNIYEPLSTTATIQDWEEVFWGMQD